MGFRTEPVLHVTLPFTVYYQTTQLRVVIRDFLLLHSGVVGLACPLSFSYILLSILFLKAQQSIWGGAVFLLLLFVFGYMSHLEWGMEWV